MEQFNSSPYSLSSSPYGCWPSTPTVVPSDLSPYTANAYAPQTVDLNTFLLCVVGNYSLTYIQDGRRVTIGSLDVASLQPAQPAPLHAPLWPHVSTSPSQGNLRNTSRPASCARSYMDIMRLNLKEWGVDPTPEAIASLEKLKQLLMEVGNVPSRGLAALLLKQFSPRSRDYSYRSGKAPRRGWPLGVTYRNAAHMRAQERLATIVWCYINPRHHILDVSRIHQTATQFDSSQRFKLWHQVLETRYIIKRTDL